MVRSAKYWWHVAAVATIAVWGTTFVSTKVLIQSGLSPAEIFTYRFILAYIAIWIFSPRRKLWADSLKDELLMAAVGFTGGSLYFITENTALETTLASNVSLLVCTAPVWTMLLSRAIWPRERVGGRLWLGTSAALAGSALVIFNGSFVLELSPVGDILSIAAALSWAVYSVLMRGLGERYSTMFITRKVFFWGLVTLLPFLVLPGTGYHPAVLTQPAVWSNLLFLGLVASFACFAVWNRVMKEIGVVSSSNYIYLNPVFTMAAAALVLSERITWIAVCGLVLIAGGLWLAEKRTT
ncbi:MAG: DMT family transporter [Alistipes sp.]|nr:DMT family transporter [Alistipes sp.]